MRRRKSKPWQYFLSVLLLCAMSLQTPPQASAEGIGAYPPGTRLMHRDLNASDSVPWSGPTDPRLAAWSIPGATCSTLFQGSDAMVIGLCTRYVGTAHGLNVNVPSVVLFDPVSAQPLAVRELHKDGLLGGVYGFLDESNRVVIGEGHSIVRIGYHHTGSSWVFEADETIPLPDLGTNASLAGVIPDGIGRVWFATTDAVVGVIDQDSNVRMTRLGANAAQAESIANGLTGRPQGVSVLTSSALYELEAQGNGDIETSWRRDYDRGSGRKPGQLSWGSGTTPTVFGADGEYVAIVDNADVSPNLHVYDAKTGEDVCTLAAFETSGPGTENSLMASGNSVWIPSTYGFDYPPFAVDGPSVPAAAAFTGGLTKINVLAQPSGDAQCVREWERPTRIASLPILTTGDFKIWALTTGDAQGNGPQNVSLLGVDAASGEEVSRVPLGLAPFDAPLQLTGMMTAQGELWQGTATRVLRVAGAATYSPSVEFPSNSSQSMFQ